MAKIKTILVTGGNGQLGLVLKSFEASYSQYIFTFIDRTKLDLCNTSAIKHFFKHNQFDLIINCAAYTAVDKAEQDRVLANEINFIAVKTLSEIVKHYDSILIHISTDYVFDGMSHLPYVESDKTDPKSFYGLSKLKAEQAIQVISPKAIIIRTSWLYSEFGHNFVKTMMRLGRERESLNIVFDQVGTPTYANDLGRSILAIVDSCSRGVHNDTFNTNEVQLYHYSNEGVCSWYDFAKAIFGLSNISCDIKPILTGDYQELVSRPHYCVLNKTKIKHAFDLDIPYWKDSLQRCLTNIEEKSSS